MERLSIKKDNKLSQLLCENHGSVLYLIVAIAICGQPLIKPHQDGITGRLNNFTIFENSKMVLKKLNFQTHNINNFCSIFSVVQQRFRELIK